MQPCGCGANFEVQGLFTGGTHGKAQCTETQAAGIQRQTISPFLLLQGTLSRRKVANVTLTSVCSIKNKGEKWNDCQNIKYNCDWEKNETVVPFKLLHFIKV